MGITNIQIRKLIQKNLKHIQGQVVKFQYYLLKDNPVNYDADDGNFEHSLPIVNFECKVIITNFSFTKTMSMIKGIETDQIQDKDRKGLLLSLYCPDGFEPQKDDYIIALETKGNILTGNKFNIWGFSTDLTNNLHILHLRPIN